MTAAEFQLHPRHKNWGMEPFFLGLVGAGFLYVSYAKLWHLTIVPETIVLVVFLGGLMGITRIPFPKSWRGKAIPLWVYALISGGISGFMDSFLVLMMVGKAELVGSEKDKFQFRALNMIAALIGGLTLYFGEVYMLPLALKYGMRYWYSMLPVVPPVIAFLFYLSWRLSKLNIQVVGIKNMEGGHKKSTADRGDYLEFAGAIALLLVTHDAVLCLGVLLLYSYITGQGEDLIDVLKTETEMGVMLLLVFAALIAVPIEPFMAQLSGWWAFIPSTINGVLTGAIFPASGDVWFDTHILSTAVLITPVSSLVGVMLFKTWSEWVAYMKLSFALAAIWFLLCGAWFHGVWPMLEDPFYKVFPKPSLVESPR